jgi:hypothetical protein
MPKPHRPVSPQRLAANRANAARSTGPRSAEGKARSAQNARKHQFTGSTFAVVRLEDLQEIAHLRDDLVALYQPVNSQEIFALERVALAQHAILRGARLESGFFTTCLDQSFDRAGEPIRLMDPVIAGDGDIEVTRAQNRNYLLGDGFHRMARETNSFTLLLRYQAQAERHYRRAIQEFDRLKALREELPTEPITEPDLEPKTTTYPDPPTNPNSPGKTSQNGASNQLPGFAATAQFSPPVPACDGPAHPASVRQHGFIPNCSASAIAGQLGARNIEGQSCSATLPADGAGSVASTGGMDAASQGRGSPQPTIPDPLPRPGG